MAWNHSRPATSGQDQTQWQDALQVSLVDEQLLEEMRMTTELMLAAGASTTDLSPDAIDAVLFFLEVPHQRPSGLRALPAEDSLAGPRAEAR